MDNKRNMNCRHYVSYTGVGLPLKLITPIEGEVLDGRISYFSGYFDDKEQLRIVEKVVYGEVEFEHHYSYYDDGRIKTAELIEPDEEPRVMAFD